MATTKSRRTRRKAMVARDQILAAARERLVRYGPDGLRLAEIAGDVGTTHPSILHHFGSRDGLMRALVEDAMQRVHTSLLGLVSQADTGGLPIFALMEQAHAAFRDGGTAVLIQWAVSQEPKLVMPILSKHLNAFVSAVHTERMAALSKSNAVDVSALHNDTRRLVFIGAIFVLGDVVMGDWLRQALALDQDDHAQSRTLFTRLMVPHLINGAPKAVDAGRLPTHIES